MPQAAKWACPEQLHFITHITWAGTPCNGGNDVMSVMSVMSVMVGEDSALSLGADKECPTARAPGAGGCKGLILLCPLSAGRRTVPRKATCGEFWVPFAIKRYKTPRGTRRKWASCFCEAIAVPYERTNMGEHANMRTWGVRPCSHVRVFVTRASRSRQPQPKSRVSSGSARCCGTPRDRPRSEARYTRCGPIRCTRSAKRR